MSRPIENPARRLAAQSLLLIVLTLVASAGCDVVRTAAPIGDQQVALDPNTWNGVWATPDDLPACLGPVEAGQARGDDCLVITVVNAQEGLLAITPTEGDHPIWAYVRSAQGTTGQSAMFLSLAGDGDSDGMWVRAHKADNLIVTWNPEATAFRELVRAGLLPAIERPAGGADRETEVELQPLDAAALAVLVDDRARALFDWADPVVYVRVRTW
jgi:hypothetical protein